MLRFGARISRTCVASDMSISVPSTGVARTHRRSAIPIECSSISTNEYPRPWMLALADRSNVSLPSFAMRRTLLKFQRLSSSEPSTVTGSVRSTLPYPWT